MAAKVAIAKPIGQQREHQEQTEQGLNSWIGETQSGSPLSIDFNRLVKPLESLFTDGAIVAE
jgi:hypothetical protein